MSPRGEESPVCLYLEDDQPLLTSVAPPARAPIADLEPQGRQSWSFFTRIVDSGAEHRAAVVLQRRGRAACCREGLRA